jgi:hypothetical protein
MQSIKYPQVNVVLEYSRRSQIWQFLQIKNKPRLFVSFSFLLYLLKCVKQWPVL